MSKNKPEESKNLPAEPANIQMTPVEFSPAPSENSIGPVGGYLPMRERQYPLALPVGIMLLTLIFSTVRDIATFNRSIDEIARTDAPGQEMLKKSSKQTEFIEGVRSDLQKLAPTDPTAAQILKEFFPPEKKPGQDSAAPAK